MSGAHMRQTLFLLAMALCAACTREKAGNASASAYTSDSDSSAREVGIAGTNSGAELQAPRLLPAIQNQLNLMGKGAQPVNRDNLTAYKNMAGDLINSMIADILPRRLRRLRALPGPERFSSQRARRRSRDRRHFGPLPATPAHPADAAPDSALPASHRERSRQATIVPKSASGGIHVSFWPRMRPYGWHARCSGTPTWPADQAGPGWNAALHP